MKEMLYKIWAYVATGAVVLVLIFYLINTVRLGSSRTETKVYKDSLYQCQHAPQHTDTNTVTTTVKPSDTIHPVPVSHVHYVKPTQTQSPPNGPVAHIDSAADDSGCIQESFYKETYTKISKDDTISIQWSSHVWGEIDWIKFDEIKYPKVYITTTKTVIVKSPPEYIAKNHYGAYVDLFAKDFKNMPGGGLGMWFSVKDRWGMRAGADYNTYHSELYGRVGITLNFK